MRQAIKQRSDAAGDEVQAAPKGPGFPRADADAAVDARLNGRNRTRPAATRVRGSRV
ncbi:hypothetical protein PF011_g1721 [Phytophthora fragariae]|uniref:Uncharacterized protein n=1 Tax=Phytophthora fragariae TaxID=53985 RepID=A0A6A3MEG8_9STRA|nr:hypothetical protein PF003_g4299 [Phytophthora fragariae]KAE9028130.1 hypothetical protein PF011_g1721 [Phytophthora fragariae]